MKKVTRPITAWTDYPIAELGDKPGQKAPIRHVQVLGYDGNKYADVLVIGTEVRTNFKAGYLYRKPGRIELKTLNGKQQVVGPKAVSTDKLNRAFGRDTVARFYAKRGIKIKRTRDGGFYFIN